MLTPVAATPRHLESYRSSVREGAAEAIHRDAPALAGKRLLRVDATPYGVAEILHALDDPLRCDQMGSRGREDVRERFLITRYLHDYVGMFVKRSGAIPGV